MAIPWLTLSIQAKHLGVISKCLSFPHTLRSVLQATSDEYHHNHPAPGFPTWLSSVLSWWLHNLDPCFLSCPIPLSILCKAAIIIKEEEGCGEDGNGRKKVEEEVVGSDCVPAKILPVTSGLIQRKTPAWFAPLPNTVPALFPLLLSSSPTPYECSVLCPNLRLLTLIVFTPSSALPRFPGRLNPHMSWWQVNFFCVTCLTIVYKSNLYPWSSWHLLCFSSLGMWHLVWHGFVLILVERKERKGVLSFFFFSASLAQESVSRKPDICKYSRDW